MKIVFDENTIFISSSFELEIDLKNNMVKTKENLKKQEVYLKGTNLDLYINNSLEIEEEYTRSEKVEYSLHIKDNLDIKNLCFVKTLNDNIKKKVFLGNQINYEQIIIDLNRNNLDFTSNIEINGKNSYCYSRVASLCNDCQKRISISVDHKDQSSFSLLENYGVVLQAGDLLIEAVGRIEKDCSLSKVLQKNKIILFDPLSKGETKPLLYIDENDVQASHAASVGKVDDNQLFYLCSRGISYKDAKKEIAVGYLKPILEYIKDENYKNKINDLIGKEGF